MHDGRDLLLAGATVAVLTVLFYLAFADLLRPPSHAGGGRHELAPNLAFAMSPGLR